MTTVPFSSGLARLRYQVTVQQNQVARSGSGDATPVWTDLATAWAAIEPARAREFIAAGRIEEETTHVITMRFMTGLDPSMRIHWVDTSQGTPGKDRYFDIQAIIDIDERHRFFEITAIERLNIDE
jgi:SPP1 family predicted phage head-tail adaptor